MCKIRKLFATHLTFFFFSHSVSFQVSKRNFPWPEKEHIDVQKWNPLWCSMRFLHPGKSMNMCRWSCLFIYFFFCGRKCIIFWGKFVHRKCRKLGKLKDITEQKGILLIASLNVCLISFELAVCPAVPHAHQHTHTHTHRQRHAQHLICA